MTRPSRASRGCACVAILALAAGSIDRAQASGEAVPLAPFDLPPATTVTLTFEVDVDSPLGACSDRILNQGTVTAAGLSVLTDDPAQGGAADPTRTPLDVVELSITKTDGSAIEIPGTVVSYTIVARNTGSATATPANVADPFPAIVSGVTWSCTAAGGAACGAGGSGNLADAATLPPGGSATYVATGTIAPAATGSIANTATVTRSPGQTECNPADNAATDSNALVPLADLRITKTDGVTTLEVGSTTVYTIVASNTGPSDVAGATVTDTFPPACTGAAWVCSGSVGGACTASGNGNINDTVALPAGASVTYLAGCTVAANASGTLANTAAVAAPGGVTESAPADNSATDVDFIEPLFRNGFEPVPVAGAASRGCVGPCPGGEE